MVMSHNIYCLLDTDLTKDIGPAREGTTRDQGIRSRAFTTLAHKGLLEQKLYKTRMCRSVAMNTPCPHGPSCRFAHNDSELVVSQCLFGSDCRFVGVKAGLLVNIGDQVCKHKHPGETLEEFRHRTEACGVCRVVGN